MSNATKKANAIAMPKISQLRLIRLANSPSHWFAKIQLTGKAISAAKKTGFGPLAMGGCRTLNVLLGMSSAFASPIFTGYAIDQWFVAIGIGVYVMGITWFARSEADTSPRGRLILGLMVMGLGICVLAAFPWFSSLPLHLRSRVVWPTLLVLLMVSVVRRCVVAISLRHRRPLRH